MALTVDWRLAPGIRLEPSGRGGLLLCGRHAESLELAKEGGALAAALLRLVEGTTAEALLAAGASTGDKARLLHHLASLRRHGFLVAELRGGDGLLATLLPRSRDFEVDRAAARDEALQLSRFASLRREGESLLLECTEAPCAALLHHPALLASLHELVRPSRLPAQGDIAQVLLHLAEQGFLVAAAEEASSAQRSWSFHDRLFHRRSRLHDDFQPHGGTYPFAGGGSETTFPSPPALRPAYAGEVLPLPLPAPARSRPLAEVMEARRSCREMSEAPLALGQLAALLHRVARIRALRERAGQDLLSRPYPSAGAIHELEFYLAVERCRDLAAGFYHYRGLEHALVRLESGTEPAGKMIGDCARAWGREAQRPQALLVLSARLPRLAWKYEALAYRLALLDAGVVLQSLYLVASDLGLNCAAAGSGRPQLFAQATGASSWEETSIAEFGFGRADAP